MLAESFRKTTLRLNAIAQRFAGPESNRANFLNLDTAMPSLHRAIYAGDYPAFVVLLDEGDIGAVTTRSMSPRTKAVEIETKDVFNRTPVLLAASAKDPRFLKLLLEKNARINGIRDKNGCTPLELGSRSGRNQNVEVLIAHDVQVNPMLSNTSSSPLQAAVEEGHSEIVKCLLQHGAFRDTRRAYDNKTALDLAKERKSSTVLQVFEDDNQRTTDFSNDALGEVTEYEALQQSFLGPEGHTAKAQQYTSFVNPNLLRNNVPYFPANLVAADLDMSMYEET